MTFGPVALIIPQYEDYPNYWLKAYEQGTTTPLPIATDATGGTTAARIEIDSTGFPVTAGSARFIPFIDGDYDLWLFPTAAEADANDTTNAIQFADNLNAYPLTGSGASVSFDNLAAAKASTDLSAGNVFYIIGRPQPYKVVSSTAETLDDGNAFALAGGLFAESINNNSAINMLQYDAKTDGTTDNTALSSWQLGLDATSHISLSDGNYLHSVGITVDEGDTITGTGAATKVSSAIAYGSWFNYSGASAAITIDGEFTGFDSRRAIELVGFSIDAAAASEGISCDFLTRSKIQDVVMYGNSVASSTGLKFTNSYNNLVQSVNIDSFETGCSITIKANPDDVFSGQTHFDVVDFWNSSANGLDIIANDNVLAQLLFTKCHWKTNSGYGLTIDGTNTHQVDILGGHFEENTLGDIWTKTGVLHGVNVRAHFNNTNLVSKVKLEGDRSNILDGCEFISGGTSIEVSGNENTIGRSYHRNCASPIVINAGAENTYIARQEFVSITGTAITDNGDYTLYEGEKTLSVQVDLADNGSGNTVILGEMDEQYWIHSVKFTNETALSATPTLNVGRSTSLSQYVNAFTPAANTQFAHETVDQPSLSASFVDAGNILTVYNATGSLTGKVRVEMRLIPWKFF